MILRRLPLLTATCLLLGMGCTGSHSSGDRAGAVNWTMTILPGSPTLALGQTVLFNASTPWGREAQWSVLPATAGTISSAGLFTASGATGTATIIAVWAKDVRYTARTTVTVLPAPPPAESTPNLTAASGAQQTIPGTGTTHAVVIGETVPATTATSGNIQVRHGFSPPTK